MQDGYIKLHRCLLDSSWSSHPDFVSVWVYCLLRANYKPTTFITKSGQSISLQPGQFVTSREKISAATGVQESKVERVLKTFKSEQQIEQESKGKFRVISITNWSKYQQSEQQNEQQMNSNGTANEQQMNTDKKVKKEKKNLSELQEEILNFFEELWEVYPRKIGKEDARRHYLKTVKTFNDTQRVNLALEVYLKEVAGRDPKYIKHGSAWFHKWQDWEPQNER